jgi:pyruvate dehydrogenase E1 component
MSDSMHDDIDPLETGEWLQALDSVMQQEGRERRSLIRWNALAMVMRANDRPRMNWAGILRPLLRAPRSMMIGFNHFFRAPNDRFGGDLIYYQGHSAPGIYARSFLEGRLNESSLDNFRER